MARAVDIHEPDPLTWALGEDRLKVLRPLAAAERTTFEQVDTAARQLGITRADCYRLLGRCRASPTITALLLRTRGRAPGARLLSPELQALIENAIDEVYLRRDGPTIAALMREIERRRLE